MAMISVGVIVIGFIPAVLIAYLQITCLYSRHIRSLLRPKAEHLIIEKRWLERAARSPWQFEREWHCEMRALYRDQVPALLRSVYRFGDFETALAAEFACLTNREIAAWTFADRISHSHEMFETVVGRCLEQFGWRVSRGGNLHGIGAGLLVWNGSRRVAVRCHYGRTEVECRGVMEAVHAARKAGCEAACIVTNGRFNGSTRALADQMGVILLHCSQLDLLSDADAPAFPTEPDWAEEQRIAA